LKCKEEKRHTGTKRRFCGKYIVSEYGGGMMKKSNNNNYIARL